MVTNASLDNKAGDLRRALFQDGFHKGYAQALADVDEIISKVVEKMEPAPNSRLVKNCLEVLAGLREELGELSSEEAPVALPSNE